MAFYDELIQLLDQADKQENGIRNFYEKFWENAVSIKTEQHSEILDKLKAAGFRNAQEKGWFILSEGFHFTFFPNMGNAFTKLEECAEVFEECNDQAGIGVTQALLAIYYKNNGELARAQENIQEAISKIGETPHYLYFLGISLYQAGEVHHMLKDYDGAIEYYQKGRKIAYKGSGIDARLLSSIGIIHMEKGELQKAYECFVPALEQVKDKGNYLLESKIYSDLGSYYAKINQFEKSLECQEISIRQREEQNLKNPLITNYQELADLFLKWGKLDEAISYALKAEVLAQELKIIIKQCQCYQILSNIYDAMGDKAMALEYFKKYTQRKDEVFSQESARKIKHLSMMHEVENAQKEKEISELKNVVLKNALDEIEASVRYAKRIQEAILPPVQFIEKKFPQSFVYYAPKDVVAGDFYWMEEIGDTLLIAAADCTGHGVPGAMVSVVCSNALNRAVKEFKLSETGLILDKVADLVIESFSKSKEEMKDGMDISLLAYNKKTGEIQWSGAHNSLLYLEENKLNEIPADKQPVGNHQNRRPFKTHNLKAIAGSQYFLFTDGYADQFGGPDGKKFKFSQFKELILPMNLKESSEQYTTIKKTFESWKGNLEQLDDVCVIGVRI